MEQTGQALSAGSILAGRYRIINLLGQGGMSRVYLADDLRLNVRVAVKENLQSEAQAREQFRREAQILAHLSHPSLPRVSDHFDDAVTGRQYLVMDYVEGEDLNVMVKRLGALPERTAVAWTAQILDALDYLHSQHPPVIHRDIKPSNIKIRPSGKAVLVDFGIAKSSEGSGMTMTGARAATPGYAPPEQYGLRTDQRSDIYALGATLYSLLTGQVPPESTLRVSNLAVLVPPRQLVPGLSAEVETAMLGALELDANRRWPSAAAFRRALEEPAAQPGASAAEVLAGGMATTRVSSQPPMVSKHATPRPSIQPAFATAPPPTQAVIVPPAKPRMWLWAVGGLVAAVLVLGTAAVILMPDLLSQRVSPVIVTTTPALAMNPPATQTSLPLPTTNFGATQEALVAGFAATQTAQSVALSSTQAAARPTETNPPAATFAPPTATVVPATATLQPTATVRPRPTNTAPPPTARPTPTPAGPPTVAVVAIRVDPADTRRKQDITFFIKFRNTFGVPQTKTWSIWVYQEDMPRNAFWRMEPASTVTLPPGDTELASSPTMRVGGTGGALTFIAYVKYIAADGAPSPVPDLNGGNSALSFVVNP